jgi:hypothetical protein
MGNQMFQLAFAHAASRRLGTTFVLGPGNLWEYFELGAWGRLPVRLRRKLEFRVRYGRAPDRVVVDNESDPAEVLRGLRDGVAYNGFFQSQRFFEAYADEVRELYRICPHHQADFAARYPDLGSYACIHVRRGDYLDNGWALPGSYYADALAVADRPGDRVIVVSDDPPRVEQELRCLLPAQYESNPAIVDLQLLINADVVVTSNSSFSWWGAWLNRKPGARILAPEYWVGFSAQREIPRGVIPDFWTTVPVSGTGVTQVQDNIG